MFGLSRLAKNFTTQFNVLKDERKQEYWLRIATFKQNTNADLFYVSSLNRFFTPVLLNCGPGPLLQNIPSPSPPPKLCTLNCPLSFPNGFTNSLTTYTSDRFNSVCTGNSSSVMEVGEGLGRSNELVRV